jgi:hypothetical protein
MSIRLTEDQSKALEQAKDTPPSVTDPRTQKTYVLVGLDVFERVKALVHDDEYALPDTYRAQLASAMKAGWNDPAMDEYNDYDAHRKP